MTLTLISVEDGYFAYEDEDGNEVLFAGVGPLFRQVVLWDEFDLQTAWDAARFAARKTDPWLSYVNRDDFISGLRLAVADPDSIEVVWCQDCNEPIRIENSESVNDDTAHVCSTCYDGNYRSCDDCGRTVHYESTVYTLSDYSVCSYCSDNSYSYCEECDGYYHETDSDEHSHGGCDCESPEQHFAMRNDGDPVLSQDERVTIALPSGVISAEGIAQIVRLVSNHGYEVEDYDERTQWWTLARQVESALGAQWQTKEGNYTKRLSKFAHKSQALKIPPALLSQVGCIARDNSNGVDFAIEVTRNLNLPAGDFYHEDSCWWQSYSESRCALKSNGGIGMRTFDDHGYVQGRAWIMPLRLDEDGTLQATFDSLTPDAFMVFNGYGDLSGYAPARIVAHMAGMTYRKIGFDCPPMYVNNSSGYLVSSEEIAVNYAGGHLNLRVSTHSTLHQRETSATLVAA